MKGVEVVRLTCITWERAVEKVSDVRRRATVHGEADCVHVVLCNKCTISAEPYSSHSESALRWASIASSWRAARTRSLGCNTDHWQITREMVSVCRGARDSAKYHWHRLFGLNGGFSLSFSKLFIFEHGPCGQKPGISRHELGQPLAEHLCPPQRVAGVPRLQSFAVGRCCRHCQQNFQSR